jgi:general nucleoside transport system ATP-binding protein
VESYDVRTPSVLTSAGTLSGGNQQKVVVARELSRPNKLLLASQPTRGLDVGSIEFVHSEIVKQRDEGVAVVIVSSELEEIYALSDRIAVMYEGKIVGMCGPDIPEQELGLLMAGAATADAQGNGSVPHRPDADELLQTTAPATDQATPPAEEPPRE